MNNWFCVAVAFLQFGASFHAYIERMPRFSLLMFLYALTNLVLFWMGRLGE